MTFIITRVVVACVGFANVGSQLRKLQANFMALYTILPVIHQTYAIPPISVDKTGKEQDEKFYSFSPDFLPLLWIVLADRPCDGGGG